MTESYRAFTGLDGRFTIKNIVTGMYQIVLGMDSKMLEGIGKIEIPEPIEFVSGKRVEHNFVLRPRIEITHPVGVADINFGDPIAIEWSPVPGAAYYLVQVKIPIGEKDNPWRSSIGWQVSRTEATRWEVRTDDLHWRYQFGALTLNETGTVDPRRLAPLYPGGSLTFSVTAYNQEGDCLTDSEGISYAPSANYPLWTIADAKHAISDALILDGDRLLLAGRTQEALEAYRRDAVGDSERSRIAVYALEQIELLFSQRTIPD